MSCWKACVLPLAVREARTNDAFVSPPECSIKIAGDRRSAAIVPTVEQERVSALAAQLTAVETCMRALPEGPVLEAQKKIAEELQQQILLDGLILHTMFTFRLPNLYP